MPAQGKTGPAWRATLRRQLSTDVVELVPHHSYGLPGVPDGPPRPALLPPLARTVALVVSVLAVVVLAVVGVPAWAWLAWAGFSLVALAVTVEGTVRHRVHHWLFHRGLRRYAPTVGMPYAGRSGGPWQLRMWEPYLTAGGERCIIVNLHPQYVDAILTEGDPLGSPFIQLGDTGLKKLDEVLPSTLRALFYVQNAQRNAHFMRRRHLTHVWLNHGDSDKPANFNPRHADYDVLVVCGQAGIDRYAAHGIHVEAHKFEVLGRPQALDVEPPRGPIGELAEKRVFYAPTWQGLRPEVNFSSLEIGPRIVAELVRRRVRVIFRPHPLSYRWIKRREVIKEIRAILREDRDNGGPPHVWGRTADQVWSVADCTNRSDALISDVSSVVSDWLQSEKPYAMTTMRTSVEEFRREFPLAQTAYVLRGDLENLDEVLDQLLGDDPLADARAERKRYVLGDFRGTESKEAFTAFVSRVVREGR